MGFDVVCSIEGADVIEKTDQVSMVHRTWVCSLSLIHWPENRSLTSVVKAWSETLFWNQWYFPENNTISKVKTQLM